MGALGYTFINIDFTGALLLLLLLPLPSFRKQAIAGSERQELRTARFSQKDEIESLSTASGQWNSWRGNSFSLTRPYTQTHRHTLPLVSSSGNRRDSKADYKYRLSKRNINGLFANGFSELEFYVTHGANEATAGNKGELKTRLCLPSTSSPLPSNKTVARWKTPTLTSRALARDGNFVTWRSPIDRRNQPQRCLAGLFRWKKA